MSKESKRLKMMMLTKLNWSKKLEVKLDMK